MLGPPSVSLPPAAPSSAAPAGGPEEAVTQWVTAVLQEDYQKACKLMAASAPPGTDVEKECSSGDARSTLSSMHEAWAKPGIKLPPQGQVEVAKTAPSGDTATVSDDAVSVDGHTLHDLMLIGASGDGVSGVHITLKLERHDGTWAVSGFDLG